ncbi:MAG TPA: hypothetical protein EYP09_07390 [Anaerolineae bacterium]|nr:hypothetical protein [Anaerolineae bacterium]
MAKKRRARDKERGKNWLRYLIWIGSAAAILSLILPIFAVSTPKPTPVPSPTRPPAKKAAIVDQIAVSRPSPEFISTASAYLRNAGFEVDVYQGQDITVEFYRTLPAKGYKWIVLRTHSTNEVAETELPGNPVYLFTGEHHSKDRYIREQLSLQIIRSKLLYEDSPWFFAIGPEFIRRSMVGRFDDTLIIISGCQSLNTLDLAKAFVERGASAVVGWDDWVDLAHNDRATLYLLFALSVERLTIKEAVEETMAQVGPDPTYESVLTYYPPERGHETLWTIAP